MKKVDYLMKNLIYMYILVLPIIFSGGITIKGIYFKSDILLLLIFLLYFLKVAVERDTRKRFLTGTKDFITDYISIFMVIIFIVMLVSISYSVNKKDALEGSIRFATYICFYFIIKYEINDKRTINNLINIYFITCGIVGLIGIFEYSTQFGLAADGVGVRIASTLENPNYLGAFMVIAFFPLLMMFIELKNRFKKLLYGIILCICFVSIILTISRNAIIALVIGVLLLILMYNKKAIILFVLGGIFIFANPSINDRMKGISSDSVSRIKLWKMAGKVIKDHPLLGVGNENYLNYYDQYVRLYPKLRFNSVKQIKAHNTFLKVQSELGVAGSIAFVGFIVSVIYRIYYYSKLKTNSTYRMLFKGFYVSIIAFMFMNILDSFFFDFAKVSTYFWILLAICESIVYNNILEK